MPLYNIGTHLRNEKSFISSVYTRENILKLRGNYEVKNSEKWEHMTDRWRNVSQGNGNGNT